VLGVSGGKDSTTQALYARDVLGLNPILVCLCFPPELVSLLGCDNLENLSKLGFNVNVITLATEDWKSLMRHGLEKFGNPLTSTEQALYCSVPQFAIREGLKLILWGENPALQLGDLDQLGDDIFDGNKLRKANTVKDGNTNWVDDDIQVKLKHLNRYKYPSESLYKKNRIKTVYMGPAMTDWSMINNMRRSILNGFNTRSEKPIKIGDTWGVMALDQDITLFNQTIKYLKYGFGRMTDYANDEIRNGRMKRNEAIKLVDKYDGACDRKYIRRFAKYLNMPYNEFWEIIDKFVNKKLFKRIRVDEYKKLFDVGTGLKK